MAATIFASRLREDGSLAVPSTAIDALGLHPGDEVQVQIVVLNENDAKPEATLLERAIYQMTHRTTEQIAQAQADAMKAYPPARTVPSGKTLADVVSGKWPGEENDAQIREALEELS